MDTCTVVRTTWKNSPMKAHILVICIRIASLYNSFACPLHYFGRGRASNFRRLCLLQSIRIKNNIHLITSLDMERCLGICFKCGVSRAHTLVAPAVCSIEYWICIELQHLVRSCNVTACWRQNLKVIRVVPGTICQIHNVVSGRRSEELLAWQRTYLRCKDYL